MDVTETTYEGVDSILLAQDRLSGDLL